MNQFKEWWQLPKQRRQLLTVISGALILVALAAGYLFDQPGWHKTQPS